MNELPFRLSRSQLVDFLACPRRFYLRYVRRLAWPVAPVDAETAVTLSQGSQFHQLLHRHFLGLSPTPADLEDVTLRRWWSAWQHSGLTLPAGQRLPELSLTVPVGQHLLHGRFDLLILGEEGEQPAAYLFDWKTGHPRREVALRQDWQTRLYLAMLAEGSSALRAQAQSPWATSAMLRPEQITLTYWFIQAPTEPRTIRYHAAWHAQNWAEIQAVVAQIAAQTDWPLIEDGEECGHCAFAAYCGRPGGKTAVSLADEASEAAELFTDLEPDLL